jgi:hypothetical protein
MYVTNNSLRTLKELALQLRRPHKSEHLEGHGGIGT